MGDFWPITKWVGSGVNRKGDKFHRGNPNFEVQNALVQEIRPFLAPDLNSRMTSPIENLHFPGLISRKLWQEKSCPPGFPIILGSSFKWDHFRPILWKLNRPHFEQFCENWMDPIETLNKIGGDLYIRLSVHHPMRFRLLTRKYRKEGIRPRPLPPENQWRGRGLFESKNCS